MNESGLQRMLPPVSSPLRRSWSPLVALTSAALLSCATAGPRFDPSIAPGLAQEPMRHLETAHVEMYYPASKRDAAEHVAARLDECVVAIRARAQPNHSQQKVLVYLTLSNFNNAFVQPEYFGSPLQMVLPVHTTLETDNFLDFGTVVEGNTACHEALHYIQNQQTNGFWWLLNAIGGAVATPSQGLERWFTEGLAVWTEGHTGLKTARPISPFWRGVFEGTVEARGYQLRTGDLSIETRDVYGSGAYLIGYYFIDYLVRTYGEQRLWELIDMEGASVFFNFGVALRFDLVYGRTLGELFDDFSAEISRTMPRRSQPPGQHVLVGNVGEFARLATSHADGAVAVASDGYDTPPQLAVYEQNGFLRFRKALTWLVPIRPWINVSASTISGMRFSPDGRKLYLVASGLSMRGDDVARLWELDARDGSLLRSWEVNGFGGDLSPDGHKYLYVDIDSDRSNLVELDLGTGMRTVLTHFDPMRSLGSPAYSPDGARVTFPMWTGESFDLALREPDGQITQLTDDGRSNYGPQWVDDHRLVFLRELAGRWQVHLIDTRTRAITPISDVPHLAIDPMVEHGNRVLFLNRDGVSFSLDSIPIPEALPPQQPRPTESIYPLPPEAVPSVPIIKDEPYSPFDGLFVPILHTPFLNYRRDATHSFILTAGVSVSGSDRLGYHNYALNLWTDTVTKQPSFVFQYGLNRFAPIFVLADLERTISNTNGIVSELREASLSVGRSFWDTPVALSFTGLQQSNSATGMTQLIGPGASFAYNASETTPYGGVRRSLRFGASAEVFPAALGSSLTMGDLRGTAGVTFPLPFSRRHKLSLDVVLRTLPGATPGLLEVGGIGGGYLVGGGCLQRCGAGLGEPLPGGVYFTEPLQGYEDFVFLTNRAAITSAHYVYPFIIDRGLTSVLYLLPSLWVSQLNLGLFGTAAYMDPGGQARAVGATLTLYTLWGQAVPITVAYSFAYRFDAGLKPLHMVTLLY